MPRTVSANNASVILNSALDARTSVVFPIPLTCLAGFVRIREPMCGRSFVSARAAEAMEPRCRFCRVKLFAFGRAEVRPLPDALIVAAVLLKYEEVTRRGAWFAARLAEIVPPAPHDWPADVVVPVPLQRDRPRERGYHQAELIARPLAKRLGLKLEKYLLARTPPRPPQWVLCRSDHWKSLRGAYATREGLQVDNLRVLLIDDVWTTGATLDAGARALKKAGAAAVLGLAVARVGSGPAVPRSVAAPGAWRGQPKPGGHQQHPNQQGFCRAAQRRRDGESTQNRPTSSAHDWARGSRARSCAATAAAFAQQQTLGDAGARAGPQRDL
ncbi:MAG TPA: phosphoribosyltransferase family protein [Candidatus Acidoferrales bacterium]|nr:phosphoribosyltransferase family protein [Candidatus Acidoferrales bacterium]